MVSRIKRQATTADRSPQTFSCVTFTPRPGTRTVLAKDVTLRLGVTTAVAAELALRLGMRTVSAPILPTFNGLDARRVGLSSTATLLPRSEFFG